MMQKDKIKILVEEAVESVLAERRFKRNYKLSTEYVNSLKKTNPELLKMLEKQAEFVISAVKNGYSPKDKVKSLNNKLNMEDDLDPRDTADTHGIRLVLDYLISKRNIPKPGEFAGKTKRWYQAAIDAVLQATYDKKPINPTHERKEYSANILSEEVVRKSFLMDLPVDLLKISNIFSNNGYQLYVVGGAVRDALLGKSPKDYDLATNAKPEEILGMFSEDPDYHTTEVGKAFGVINVYSKEKNEYEIATFRRDIGAGRRPDAVEFTTIEDDVKRRDLTINALFYDIKNREIVDFVGGIADLENKTIKSVGVATERFAEDRLRILRAIRFTARMGTTLDPETEEAILHDNSLSGVSPERVRDEFLKSIKSARSIITLMNLYEGFDLWPQIFPNLKVNEQYEETKNIPVLLGLLLRENNPKNLGKQMNKLSYSVVETKQIVFLVMFQGLSFQNAYQLKKLFRSTRLSNNDLLEFGILCPKLDGRLVKAFTKYELSVNGQDLLNQGLKGRELGTELERRENTLFMELV